MTLSLPDQAIFVTLVSVVILIVVGKTLSWLGRMALLALVAATIFVWCEPGLVGTWITHVTHVLRSSTILAKKAEIFDR